MQSTGVLNLSIGLTGVKEKCGVHLSYMCLARGRQPHFLCFFPTPRRRRSFRLPSAAATPRRRPCTPSPAFYAAAASRSMRRPPSRLPAQTAATHSLHNRRSRAARLRRPRAPTPVCRHHCVPPHHCHALSAIHTAAPPHRSRSTFSPSARQVFDRLPDRDGSREEEGKGSCG